MKSLRLNKKNSDVTEKYPNYQTNWEEYRIIHRNLQIFGVGLIMLLFMLFLLTSFISGSYLILSIFVFGLVTTFYIFKLHDWKCPECLKSFHKKDFGEMEFFLEKCANCGLPKYEGSIFKK